MYGSGGVLNATASGINYVQSGGMLELTPLLDTSVTGAGGANDPYILSGSYEYTDSMKTDFNYPEESQFLL